MVVVRTEHAWVAAEGEAEELARRVARLVDEAAPAIAPVVGAQDVGPVRAHVYAEREQFLRATGLPRESRIAGLATFPEEAIHVDGTGVLVSIEKVVPHEVGHVMIARAAGPGLAALPRWLNEGIAEYVAGERAAQVDPVALRAIGEGRALEVSELDGAIEGGGEGSALAYAESASLVHFLVAERGEGVIAELLAALRRSGDFEAALEEVTGWHIEELESNWRAGVARRWRWHMLFQSPVLIFGLMLLLFAAGVVRYVRERRRRKDMAEGDW